MSVGVNSLLYTILQLHDHVYNTLLTLCARICVYTFVYMFVHTSLHTAHCLRGYCMAQATIFTGIVLTCKTPQVSDGSLS
jgi:hypothetical protein